MKLVSWNVNGLSASWDILASDPEVDVALVQEASRPLSTFGGEVLPTLDGMWRTGGWANRPWRTAIVRLSDRVNVTPVEMTTLDESATGAVPESQEGTLTVAEVRSERIEPISVASVYSTWEVPISGGWEMADASAHRIISDLSPLVTKEVGNRLIVAGDWNLLYGYGEHGSPYWAARYKTVFDRLAAIGLRFVGPQHPNGIQADPWPDELPTSSLNVPTFGPRNGIATRQLDFVFASETIADQVTVTALNSPEDWGPSDHCRVLIEVSPD